MIFQAIKEKSPEKLISAIESSEDVNQMDAESGMTPLIMACSLGEVELVDFF